MASMTNTCSTTPSPAAGAERPRFAQVGVLSPGRVGPQRACGVGSNRPVGRGGARLGDPPWRPRAAALGRPAGVTVERVRRSSSAPGPTQRSHSRAVAVRRRQAVVLGLIAAAAVVALILPWGGAGGRPLATSGSAPTGGALLAHQDYVVQPGDTLWTIASRLDPRGDPRPLVDAMTAEIGGGTLVSGERILLP